MQKIMFNDRYCLTQAVIEGRKTMTRRVMSQQPSGDLQCMSDEMNQDKITWTTRAHFTSGAEGKAQYYVGEIVAVSQSYDKAGLFWDSIVSKQKDHRCARTNRGWSNKMYVKADMMPHRIRITKVRAERLQDITDEDCLSEGVIEHPYCGYMIDGIVYKGCQDKKYNGSLKIFDTPRKAFASLIDKVSGKGTWELNPWVWVYEFELVK